MQGLGRQAPSTAHPEVNNATAILYNIKELDKNRAGLHSNIKIKHSILNESHFAKFNAHQTYPLYSIPKVCWKNSAYNVQCINGQY